VTVDFFQSTPLSILLLKIVKCAVYLAVTYDELMSDAIDLVYDDT
jgi:hypothetical protein